MQNVTEKTTVKSQSQIIYCDKTINRYFWKDFNYEHETDVFFKYMFQD